MIRYVKVCEKRYEVGSISEAAMAVVEAEGNLRLAANKFASKDSNVPDKCATLTEAALEYAGWFATLIAAKKNAAEEMGLAKT